MLREEIRRFVRDDARERFLRYVQIHTTSDEKSSTKPTTSRQIDLLRMLESECRALGLEEVHRSDAGYVYANLPASNGVACDGFGLLAHVDTSPEQPGADVRPAVHGPYGGAPIRFADDSELALTEADSPELAHFHGDKIITASGKTLLGADDKAGVAEIMSALAAFRRFPELRHGPITACFTSDEEVGRGTQDLDLSRLPRYCYTMDGSVPGELEAECFDAWKATLEFRGVGVHPGFAKDKMLNAAVVAARFVAALPEAESPERTAGREGFYYVYAVRGGCERAEVELIVRDFEAERNRARLDHLARMKEDFEHRFPRLAISLETKQQYRNMRDILAQHPRVIELALGAIADTGLDPVQKSIRGGTDGSKLTELGHPTPNIFAGGMLFHSRKEWIAESSLALATETILHLARRWAEAE
ncbi:MAG: peptidase T [Planctomycetes bacterium]|nr:peptidase T [Planctomycetota bacterium]